MLQFLTPAVGGRRVVTRSTVDLDALPGRGRSSADGKFRAAAKRFAEHAESHVEILAEIADFEDSAAGTPPRLDLIVVPAARSFRSSRQALTSIVAVAQELESRVLVLASGDARPEDFPEELRSGTTVPVAVLDARHRISLPSFRADRHRLAQLSWHGYGDLATKRNLGLMFAAAMGRRNVLFLDDDISCPAVPAGTSGSDFFGAGSLRRALGVLAGDNPIEVAGWAMTNFPDNSVVCHARRLAGKRQESFISGGALLVKVNTSTPFFPRLYNEDWLFFRSLLGRSGGRPVIARAGVIGQQPYDPYEKDRAAREELADLFAEATFSALGCGAPARDLAHSKHFWLAVVERRKAMIKEIRRDLMPWRKAGLARLSRRLGSGRRLAELPGDSVRAVRRRLRAWRALGTSLAVITDAQQAQLDLPQLFITYQQAMRKDLELWRAVLGKASPAPFLGALRHAQFSGCSGPHDFVAGPGSPVVEQLSADRWQVLKGLRLKALRDASAALFGDREAEVAYTEEEWRLETKIAHWFVALSDGVPAGIGKINPNAWPGECMHIEAMWVAPSMRRRGIARHLVVEMENAARELGQTELGLWVFVGNERAKNLYRGLGYSGPKRTQPLRVGDRFRVEEEFVKALVPQERRSGVPDCRRGGESGAALARLPLTRYRPGGA